MDRYFYDVVNSDTWLKCPANLACSILSSSNIYVESEAIVWNAFKRLIQANADLKENEIHRVMSEIRLHLLTPQFIKDEVLSFSAVSNNILCRNLIDEAILRFDLKSSSCNFELAAYFLTSELN